MPNMYLPIKTDFFRQMGLKRPSKELGSTLEYFEHNLWDSTAYITQH